MLTSKIYIEHMLMRYLVFLALKSITTEAENLERVVWPLSYFGELVGIQLEQVGYTGNTTIMAAVRTVANFSE